MTKQERDKIIDEAFRVIELEKALMEIIDTNRLLDLVRLRLEGHELPKLKGK